MITEIIGLVLKLQVTQAFQLKLDDLEGLSMLQHQGPACWKLF